MSRASIAVLVAVVTLMLATLAPTPSAAQTGSLSAILLDPVTNVPLGGVRVTFTSVGTSLTATTDAQGRVSVSLPPGVYDIVASRGGFSTVAAHQVVVTADQTLSITLRLGGGTPSPPPTRPPTSAPTPAATSTPRAGIVHDSLLATYNKLHPEHSGTEPYYGRYTYVLLLGGADAVPKNRSLLEALVAKYAAPGTNIPVGPPADVPNPFGYNIFFLPVIANAGPITVSADIVDRLLHEYDYGAAREIRRRYCAVPSHGSYSVCITPYNDGPVMLTFIRPLPGNGSSTAFPPAFAYDFNAVLPAQYAQARDAIAKTIVVPEPILNDTILPPSFLMKYVAPLLASIADALSVLVPKLKWYEDAGLKPA